MRSLVLRKYVFTIVLAFSAPALLGQVITGTYPYGTFDNKGFDTINVGNLNVHFVVPIINKTGRGLPFWYNLSYDSSVWSPMTVNGSPVWTPAPSFGWRGDTEIATGYLSYSVVTVQVGSGGQRSGECIYTYDTNWVYHDPFGVAHQFSGYTVSNSYPTNCGADQSTASLSSWDGSGYALNLTSYTKGTIVGADGKQIAVPNISNGTATATDSNGNQVSADGNGHFTDTTGNVILTVAGTAPSPHTFTYKDTSGNPQTVSMTYKAYTVQTAFGCNGIGEYAPTATSLVDSISFPDGSAYHFTYEATPNGSGNVTGRLASVTLPQGGTISYTYTGGNQGVICSDGSTSGLTRSLSADGGSAASTWSYARNIPGTNLSHTEVTDGLTNHSAYDFVQASNQITTSTTTSAVYYETNRNMYQGAETGTPLLSRQTCYNAQAQPCTTASFTVPISQIDTYETLNGIEQHGSTAKYNASGLQTDQYDYDFGGSSRGSLLRHEVWTYGGSLAGLVTVDQVYDGSGHLANQTNYGYDETQGPGHASLVGTSGLLGHTTVSSTRGNLTTASQWINSTGATLSTMAAYEDTGDALNATSPNGQTNYSYDSTHTFVLGVTPPTPSSGISLPSSTAYDVTTGLLTSTTDPNGTKTSYSYNSTLQPIEIDVYDSSNDKVGMTNLGYSSTQSSLYYHQNATATTDTETLYDGYGRQSRVAVGNGQNSNPWYQQDTCYDKNGNISFQAYSYQGNGWGTVKVCSGSGDSYTYDALGRIKSLKHADGSSILYTYTGRATEVTDENSVSRIAQVDGLGRTTYICELSGNSLQGDAPSTCGLDLSGTGFLTNYVYDLANHKVTINAMQGTTIAQQRIFQTDWLGRTTLVQEPERGGTQTTYSYSYNGTGLVVTRQRPQANQNAGATTTTTTQYDSIGRVVSVSYMNGTSPDPNTPTKSYTYDLSQLSGLTLQNPKGRMVQQMSGTNAGAIYSYDPMGRVASLYECTPSKCGATAYTASFTYDWLGNLLTATNVDGVKTSYNNYSPANEAGTITSTLSDSTHPGTLVSQTVYGPNGPQSYTLGNGLETSFSYDTLGRRQGGWLCQGSVQNSCTGGTQIYGYYATWSGTYLSGLSDTVLNRGTSYGYDEFGRLKSSTTVNGTQQNFSYVYDRYGNRWQQNVTAGSGPPFSVSFDKTSNRINSTGYGYDAPGNLTSDSFHSYSYDAEGNVIKVDNGTTAQYTYDALNQRIRMDQGGGSNEFVFDPSGKRIAAWDSSHGYELQSQVYWGRMPIEFNEAGVAHFQQQDYLGTERMRTTYSGSVEGSFFSLPYGDGFSSSGSDNDAYHFAILDHDYYSNTEHAQFRQYSNEEGRWHSPDPYNGSYDFTNPQSLNRYAYVLNNPLSLIDPLGLDWSECWGNTCIVVGTGGIGLGIGGCEGDGVGSCAFPLPPCEHGPRWGNCTNAFPVLTSVKPGGAPKNFTCHDLAAGKTPSSSFSNWWAGYVNASSMLDNWLAGTGPADTTFGPGSPESQQMMGAYGLAGNVNSFLNGGPSSGFQNFGLKGLLASGLNPTAQFVGSYGWRMSLSGGNLNITLTNATTMYSAFYHAPGFNPNPPTPGQSVFGPPKTPMGRVNQTFNIQVPCS